MKIYDILSTDDYNKWHEYLSLLPIKQQDVYFTPDYYKLYEENDEGSARCFVFQKGKDIALYPFLMNSINTLGYELDKEYFDIQGAYGYNGIISSSYSNEFINEFYNAFHDYIQVNNIVSEFVRFHPLLGNHVFSHDFMEVIFDRETVVVPIDDTDVAEKYHSQVRKKIRRANREGIICSHTSTTHDYESFEKIYTETMEFLNAEDYYFFSKEYFEFLRKADDSNFALIVAKLDGKVIGGMWVMLWGKYAHNHLSAAKADLRNTGVNVAIQHTVIEFAKYNNAQFVHLGGGRTNDIKDSLLAFKKTFSNKVRKFYIGKKIHNQDVYNNIVLQWEKKHVDIAKKNAHILQGYRKIT